MDASFDKRMPVTTVLRDTFFPGTKTFVTEHVDLDFRKGTQAVAPFVAKGVGGINMARQGYETRTYTP
ncbi:MAG TPA: major capsid protein, partial [Firmicutes bacterium]|nr:major capsid protein [Bacillota bacterium]